MHLLPFSYMRVSDHLRVKVSRHFFYSDFGVRDSGASLLYGRRYVCTGTPGTGFIERDSDSQSYQDFVRIHPSVRARSYWDYLLGREPSYEREIARATSALQEATYPLKRWILDAYIGALTIGNSEETLRRVVDGIKHKMGHHPSSHMVSAIGHYKHKMARLEKEMNVAEFHLEQHYKAPVMEAYRVACDAFVSMLKKCRHIWYYDERSRHHFELVHFDMGIFDFIRYERYLPLMRNSQGTCYYLLPDHLLAARSSTDFDLYPLGNLPIVAQTTALDDSAKLIGGHLVNATFTLQMPTIGVSFYFSHVHPVEAFVQAVDHLKEQLSSY